ncbi:MAG: hypothetical protein LH628_09640 [Microcoleus sp. CAN_BIN18]|nr:hypothetical protein [Microcoleus sp. CAN_BIN18]
MVKYNLMSADFEVEMVLVGNLLLRTYNLPLVIEFLTTATVILARSCALGTGDRAFTESLRDRTLRRLILFEI